jgi:DNA-3-methyladenine glycosylase I
VAAYGRQKVAAPLADPGIVRNRKKVEAAVQNAGAFLRIQADLGSFDAYVWPFVGGQPLQPSWRSWQETARQTPESEALAADLKRRGFTLVGPELCYAFMQAVGMTNDHIVGCFRRRQLRGDS